MPRKPSPSWGDDPMTRQDSPDRGGSMESLYPFLYAGTTDLPAVLEQVRASTVAKVAEITELRQTVRARDEQRLARCAGDAAARFAAGGRLFGVGNRGRANDAQLTPTRIPNLVAGAAPP